MTSIQLGKRVVTSQSKPYVIAEIGVNHGGSLEMAKKLIELCREGGADAAKFQTYKAERLASRHSPAYWDTTKEQTTSQYLLFKKYDRFGPDEYVALAQHCRDVGIEFLSTPFDEMAVDALDAHLSFYKIASADLTNIPLLRKIASRRKPIVMSTGASTIAEVDDALRVLEAAGSSDIALMHCILNYPTDPNSAHLGMIQGLKERYPDRIIGYSDHVVPDDQMRTLTTAYLLGAVIIEKHFTHDKTLPGNDHYHAMDVHDLRRFVAQVNTISALVGPLREKAPLESEEPARNHARRSIVLTKDVGAGQVLSPEHLTSKRPGTGISPIHWDHVIGRRTLRAMSADTVLSWADIASET